MNTFTNQTSSNPQDSGLPKPSRPMWPAMFGTGLALLGVATFYEGSQTRDLQRQLTASQQEASALRSQMGEARTRLTSEMQALKDSISQQLSSTKADVSQVRTVAVRHADALAKKQLAESQQLAAELDKVKVSTTETAGKVEGISTAVGSTRSDLDATKTDLTATKTELQGAKSEIADAKSDLQRVRGDMGLMSGLVATNSKDIQHLRDLGDRNIFEFNIAKSAGMQKVGDIQLALRKTDPRHNRFTVEVLADDKLVQKRDKNTNEPVQFYTSKARQVYEVVVNRVDKDRIVGYLATPRVTLSRNESGRTN